MLAKNMAPGLKRSFAFEEWPWVDEELVAQARKNAQAAVKSDLVLDIAGSDIDARMVEMAKKNAFAAEVDQDIVFKQMRLQDLHTDKINGVIISNPPYGERLLDDEAIIKLYQEMGQTFEPLKTWSKFILTSDEQFEQRFGKQADKKRKGRKNEKDSVTYYCSCAFGAFNCNGICGGRRYFHHNFR